MGGLRIGIRGTGMRMGKYLAIGVLLLLSVACGSAAVQTPGSHGNPITNPYTDPGAYRDTPTCSHTDAGTDGDTDP